MVKPNSCMRNTGADEGKGNGHHGNENRPKRSQKEKDDDHDDEQSVAQGLGHLADGVGDVIGGVVGHARRHAGGKLRLDGLHFPGHPLGRRRWNWRWAGAIMPMNTAVLARKADLRVVVLRAQHDLADVLQPDDGPVLLPDDEPFELPDRAQVGIGDEIDLDEGTLGFAHRRQEVVCGQGLAHLPGADVESRHPVGLEPDAHGECPRAQDVGRAWTPSMAESRGWTTRTR